MTGSGKHKLYVGIDVHRIEHRAALLPLSLLEQPGNLWRKVVPLSIRNHAGDFEKLEAAIRSYCRHPDEAIIAVDHTGGHYSEPLVAFLQSRGYAVYYLETKAVKSARERFLDEENKSDVIDSTSAAYLLYLRDVHGLSFRITATPADLTSDAVILKSLVLQRWRFTKLANQATNRLHQFLLAVFPEGESDYFPQLMRVLPHYPTPRDIRESGDLKSVRGLWRKHREGILAAATSTVGIENDIYRWLIRELSLQRTNALEKIKEIDTMLGEQVMKHPYGPLLLSFPNLGPLTAATIIGITKDIANWPSKKKFRKVLGVYSSHMQSGAGSVRSRLGKEGSRYGRRALFLVCLGAIRKVSRENDFRDYYSRHLSRGKPKIQVLVSTMGKLAEIVYHCLKTGETYQCQGRYK